MSEFYRNQILSNATVLFPAPQPPRLLTISDSATIQRFFIVSTPENNLLLEHQIDGTIDQSLPVFLKRTQDMLSVHAPEMRRGPIRQQEQEREKRLKEEERLKEENLMKITCLEAEMRELRSDNQRLKKMGDDLKTLRSETRGLKQMLKNSGMPIPDGGKGGQRKEGEGSRDSMDGRVTPSEEGEDRECWDGLRGLKV